MGKEIRADIVIGGHADSSLFSLGEEITQLGNQINQISRYLIDFGKESTNNYVSYEDAMLDAKVALETTYTSASDMSKVMEELSAHALKWAQDSRFTTVDVANAISNAAHAGWDLEKILNGIPAAMKIAQAGGMDLSTGLEYLVDIANAAGIDFQYLSDFVDIWAYAANSSSTDINEMGAAMQRMGATMQFVNGDMGALTTMLAVLANNGSKGTEAGTLLRNALIRLIAPTKKAADAMSGLDLSMEDADEIYADAEAIEAAGEALEKAGFSAYDAEGNMKPVLQIWEELAQATSQMSDAERNGILYAIFPTKTITGGLALLTAAEEGWGGLYDAIMATSEGYSAYAAAVMESGLGGVERHLSSVWDTTQTKTGAALADDITIVATALSEFLEGVNNMDDASFQGLVGGLEMIALAGPALIGAGIGVKLMAALFGTGPMGWLALAAIGVTALAKGIADYSLAVEEADFEDQFGSLSYDETALGQFLYKMQEGYTEAAKGIEKYNSAVEAAFTDYETYSGSMKQTLLTQLITNAELTEDDEKKLTDLGQKMQDAIVEGIKQQQSGDEAMIAMLTGDGVGADASDPMWAAIMETLEFGYEDAKERAASLGQGLRDALTSAFSDGMLSQDEIDNINSYLDQMNQIAAERLSGDDAAAQARLIKKGQTLGLAGLESAAAEVYLQRDSILESLEDLYYGKGGLYSSAYSAGMRRVDAGEMTQSEFDAQMQFLEAKYMAARNAKNVEYDQVLAKTFSAALNESGFGDTWRMLSQFAADGFISEQEYQDYLMGNNTSSLKNARKSMDMLMETLGGYEKVMGLVDYYRGTGDIKTAGFYQSMLAMYGMAAASSEAQNEGGMQNWRDRLGLGDGYNPAFTVDVDADTEQAQSAIDALGGQTVTINVDAETTGGKFAEGGRAVTASIFGEAGPEWAIPEQHTQRTAELLAAAARASGFTWPELLSRNGGLNGGSSGSWTLVYSPVINAGDASGVEAKLLEDKSRLEKWLRDRKMHDELEVFA